MKMKKRLASRAASMFLAVVLAITSLPGVAFADTIEDACSHVIRQEHDADCYRKVLICTYGEETAVASDSDAQERTASDSDAEKVHVHTDECWDEILDCPHMKGQHDEACAYLQEKVSPKDRLNTACRDEEESGEYFNQLMEHIFNLMEDESLAEEAEAAQEDLKAHISICGFCRIRMPQTYKELPVYFKE